MAHQRILCIQCDKVYPSVWALNVHRASTCEGNTPEAVEPPAAKGPDMSDKGYTESVNEWGERQFLCMSCPTIYWFSGDMVDHVARHNRASLPAEQIQSDADKWAELGLRLDAAAQGMSKLRGEMDAMLARMDSTELVKQAHRDGYDEGFQAGRAKSYAEARILAMTDAITAARYDAIREMADFLADCGHHEAASQVRGTFLEGN